MPRVVWELSVGRVGRESSAVATSVGYRPAFFCSPRDPNKTKVGWTEFQHDL